MEGKDDFFFQKNVRQETETDETAGYERKGMPDAGN